MVIVDTMQSNKLPSQHMISKISNYMLSPKNMMQTTKMFLTKNQFIENIKVKKQKPKDFYKAKQIQKCFIPGKKDQLFWLFYIMLNGFDNYNMIENNSFTIEKETKIEYISKIKINKTMLRNMKFNKLNEVETELINDEQISLKTFHILCVIENIDFVYLDKHILFSYPSIEIEELENIVAENENNETNSKRLRNLHIIHKINDHYGYEFMNVRLLLNYTKNRLNIENLEHPLYAISHYKLDELKEIALKLNIKLHDDFGTLLKKQELYDVIKLTIHS